MKKQIKVLLSACIACTLLYACNINDFSDIKKVELTPKIALPIAKGKIRLDSMILDKVKDKSNIHIDPVTNVISFRYEKLNLINKSAKELIGDISVPAQTSTIKLSELSLGGPTATIIQGFQNNPGIIGKLPAIEINNAKENEINLQSTFTKMKFKTGNIKITITNNFPNKIKDLKLSIKNKSDNSEISKFNFTDIVSTSTNTNTLSNKIITNKILVSLTSFKTEESPTVHPININSYGITIAIEINNIVYEYVVGDFGQQIVTVPQGEFDLLNNFMDNNLLESFSFGNPTLKLKTTSTVGIDSKFALTLKGEGTTDTMSIDQVIKAAQATADYSVINESYDSLVFDKKNGLVKFLDKIPNKVSYSGEIVVNPTQPIPAQNIVRNDSKVKIDLVAEIPLNLKVTNLTFNDTIKDIGIDDINEFDALKMRIDYINKFPLSIDLSIITRGEDDTILDTIKFDKPMTAADVDADGISTTGKEGEINIDLTTKQLEKFKFTKSIIFKMTLNTSKSSGDEQTYVTFVGTNTLDISLSAEAGVKYIME